MKKKLKLFGLLIVCMIFVQNDWKIDLNKITEKIKIEEFENVFNNLSSKFDTIKNLNISETEKIISDVNEKDVEIHFLDVGQGDCILIKSGEHAMLIDAGDNDQGTKIQNYLIKQGISKLDYLVLTHPDADHIGGADVIITKFEIKKILMSDYEKDTKTYRDVIDAIKYKNVNFVYPEVGTTYEFNNIPFTIIGTENDYEDANNNSIVVKFTHGSNDFLFMGDCEAEGEEELLNNATEWLNDIEVLKIGHHGSKSSSTEEFISTIKPEFGVISCAEENDYGHPHSGPLNTLRKYNVNVYRTDEQGTIIVTSNGENLIWNMSPSDSWQSGS